MWRPWMKWPIVALAVFFAVTQPDRAADFVVACWNGAVVVAEGIFAFLGAIFERF